jgi:hypothetical protein
MTKYPTPANNNNKKETPKKVSKITMNMNFSTPIKANRPKKSTWGNYVDIYETMVEPICIAFCTHMDKEHDGSYITPMVKAFNEDETGQLTNDWKILSFLSRRGRDEDAKPGERNAMKKQEGSNYEWEAIVAFGNEDASDVGKHIAEQFSRFSKNDRQVSNTLMQHFWEILILIFIE